MLHCFAGRPVGWPCNRSMHHRKACTRQRSRVGSGRLTAAFEPGNLGESASWSWDDACRPTRPGAPSARIIPKARHETRRPIASNRIGWGRSMDRSICVCVACRLPAITDETDTVRGRWNHHASFAHSFSFLPAVPPPPPNPKHTQAPPTAATAAGGGGQPKQASRIELPLACY